MEAFLPGMAMLGLTILVLGWVAQLHQSLGKDLKVSVLFLVCQMLGCILLAVDRYSMNDQFSALLNLIACAFASLILLRVVNKKK